MMNVTGELLSKMSMEDLDKLFQQMKHPTQEQKESAWKKWIRAFMMGRVTS